MLSGNGTYQTGILIIAHNPLASAMERCVLHIFPEKKEYIASHDVTDHLTPDQGLANVLSLAGSLKVNQLLIFTDIVGATPFNLAKSLMEALSNQSKIDFSVRLISGTNIPMLVRALTYNENQIDHLTELVMQGAQQGLVCIKP